jgi:hypothetical protein
VSAADISLHRTSAAASALLGVPIDAITPVSGGRNSRVYRVTAAGRTYALKQYPSRSDDLRDRLGTEAAALELMQRHRIDGIPRILAVDAERGFALLSWLDGTPVTEVGESDVSAAAAFLAALHALRKTDEFPPDRLASEACLSAIELIRQIDSRLARLQALPAAEVDLQRFLSQSFASAFEGMTAQLRGSQQFHGIDLAAELPPDKRSLVPSDFGFHNSLRTSDGSLVFFDFEYFGWDDPAKLTADVMLHPGTVLAPDLGRSFRAAAERLYSDDPWFRRRLAAYYPLFGLRWVLILLNDFVPSHWRRREHAGAAEGWEAAKRRQLSKAQEFLARVRSEHDGRGHG